MEPVQVKIYRVWWCNTLNDCEGEQLVAVRGQAKRLAREGKNSHGDTGYEEVAVSFPISVLTKVLLRGGSRAHNIPGGIRNKS